ncbi:MAG TPA: hypothetical protein VGZ03_05660 [Acidimicrobiales bacterium]|jgi:hypothetical protein|nr:hypothetical protein [Acidimicrobiales bacterium]
MVKIREEEAAYDLAASQPLARVLRFAAALFVLLGPVGAYWEAAKSHMLHLDGATAFVAIVTVIGAWALALILAALGYLLALHCHTFRIVQEMRSNDRRQSHGSDVINPHEPTVRP